MTLIVYSLGGTDEVKTSSNYETIAFLGEGNDFIDQHPNFSGEKTASDSYFHGGSGDDAMYLKALQMLII